ncbi:MAG: hypothetical protein WCX84_08885 [Syntrophales bacterium]|jgi:V/A-type H+-transporting ATPase subunit I|nr:hypothetical protein [Syntrophales bacterium]
MIVPMKKIFIIVREKDAETTLEKIAALGMLHVNHLKSPEGTNLEKLRENIALIGQATGIIEAARGDTISPAPMEDPLELAKKVSDLDLQNKALQEEASRLLGEISRWKKWGDFSPADIARLAERNLAIRLYRVKPEQLKAIPPDVIVRELFREGPLVGCAVISRDPLDLPFSDAGLPALSLSELKRELSETKQRISKNNERIRDMAGALNSMKKRKGSLEKELELAEAISGMGKFGTLAVFSGFAPQDKVDELERTATALSWGFVAADPDEDDTVPTLLVNNRWVNSMRPLFSFIELVPGYRELDMSPVFFVFFSLFVALLVNDLGYGLLVLLLTFFAQRKWGKKTRDLTIFYFFYLMGGVIAVMGALSGTCFGQDWLPSWVQPLIPALRKDVNVQMLCFIIGAAHLSIGHLWQMALKWPRLTLLVDLGWIAVLWCSVFVANTLILGKPLSPAVFYLFGAGSALVLFFTETRGNPLRNLAKGLGNYLMNLMNNFTDVVSYIRLFAVGLAGVSVSDAFNRMAAGIGFDGVLPALIAVPIILFGHGLNLLLAPMSILVHGVRLNVLEFSNHADVKWSGVMYKPLRKGE